MENKHQKSIILPMIMINLAILVLMSIVYLLSRRFLQVSRYFNSLATIIVIFGTVEKTLIDVTTFNTGFTYILMITLVTSISLLGNCQRSLLLSYLTCSLYIFIRQYFCSIGEEFERMRHSTYCLITFMLMFILSRLYVMSQRDNFRLSRQSDQLSHLLYSFVRVNPEGILLSHGDKLVYQNDQIPKVFESLQDCASSSQKTHGLI